MVGGVRIHQFVVDQTEHLVGKPASTTQHSGESMLRAKRPMAFSAPAGDGRGRSAIQVTRSDAPVMLLGGGTGGKVCADDSQQVTAERAGYLHQLCSDPI
jgi:hypothetical protein